MFAALRLMMSWLPMPFQVLIYGALAIFIIYLVCKVVLFLIDVGKSLVGFIGGLFGL